MKLFQMFINSTAVSYTHLDVYKRQQWMEDEPESEQEPETGEPASAPYALPDLLSKSDDTKQAA